MYIMSGEVNSFLHLVVERAFIAKIACKFDGNF